MAGDVLLSFNPMQVDFYNYNIASISISEDVETGCNHGVFYSDNQNNVIKFLHKQSLETLKEIGAVNKNNKVDIDTGILYFSSKVISELVEKTKDLKALFINENTRLNLYNDFLIPASNDAKKEEYLRSESEIALNESIKNCRKILWEILNKYNFNIAKMAPAKFIHYGTTKELMKLLKSKELNFLNSKKYISTNISNNKDCNIYKSYIENNVKIKNNAYIENSLIGEKTIINNDSVLSNVKCKNIEIPSTVVLNTIKTENNKYVTRIYGINDNPKSIINEKCIFMEEQLIKVLKFYDINPKEIWLENNKDIWSANFYQICNTNEESVKSAIKFYKLMKRQLTRNEVIDYLNTDRISLKDSFLKADVSYNLELEKEIEIKVMSNTYVNYINERLDYKKANSYINTSKYLKEVVNEILKITKNDARTLLYLSKLDNQTLNLDKIKLEDLCFKNINKLASIEIDDFKLLETKKEITESLPIRINFGGGWSDTIPYCIENGGSVLNGAFMLNGTNPINCTIKKLEKKQLILKTIDLNKEKEITDIEEVLNCNNGEDDFSLLKAALIVTGLVTKDDKSLNNLFERIGGGMFFCTNVIGVPKGSGLGTSSILSACCIKAIYNFINKELSVNKLNDLVLLQEQLFGTGGGWQDQLGAVIPGIKLLTSEAGRKQHITIENLEISKKIENFFDERFLLIYTGQRRAAKKLVRNIMGNYILSEPKTLMTISSIKTISKEMFESLKEENFNKFANLMNKHWEESKKLDDGCINRSIELILETIKEFTESKMICGAGGGGFLQIIIKENAKKDDIIKIIEDVYEECGVKCYETKISK